MDEPPNAKRPVDAEFTVVSDAFNWRTDALLIVVAVVGLVGLILAGARALDVGKSDAFYMGAAGACGATIVGCVRSLIAGHRHRRQQAAKDTSGLLQLGHDTSDRL